MEAVTEAIKKVFSRDKEKSIIQSISEEIFVKED